MSETNYDRLFGTPTKVATFVCQIIRCQECPARETCNGRDKFNCRAAFCAYLREEADDD